MVSAVISAINTALSTVTGLTSVYSHAPASVQTAHLPAAIITQGRAVIQRYSVGLVRHERDYKITLACEPVAQDIPANRMAAAIALYEAVVDALVTNATIQAAVDHIVSLSDEGIQVVQIAGVDHIGYELTMTVVEKI